MNKEYLLKTIKQRIKELESKYREYFDLDKGPSRTDSGARCMRSRVKRDIGLCKLIEHLLLRCPDGMSIDSQELLDAFDRVTEPRKLK